MISLFLFVLAVGVAAGVGGRFRPGAWYRELRKPSWNPPNWIFAPVWTTLYLMIAVAGWLVWRKTGDLFEPALIAWAGQLVLNSLWTWLFFGRQRIDWALVDIGALLATIAAFIVLTGQVQPLAACLFAPYLLWVGFASTLNFRIWQLNPRA